MHSNMKWVGRREIGAWFGGRGVRGRSFVQSSSKSASHQLGGFEFETAALTVYRETAVVRSIFQVTHTGCFLSRIGLLDVTHAGPIIAYDNPGAMRAGSASAAFVGMCEGAPKCVVVQVNSQPFEFHAKVAVCCGTASPSCMMQHRGQQRTSTAEDSCDLFSCTFFSRLLMSWQFTPLVPESCF